MCGYTYTLPILYFSHSLNGYHGWIPKISQENPKKTLVFVIFCNQWDFPFKVETPNVDVGIPQYYQWDFPMLLVGFSNLTSGFPSVVSGIFQFGFGIFQFDIGIFQSLWWDFQFSFGIFQFDIGIFQFDIGIFQCFWWDFPNLHWNSPNMGYPIELGIPQVTWNIPCCNGISHVARILRRPTFSLGFPKIILAVYNQEKRTELRIRSTVTLSI